MILIALGANIPGPVGGPQETLEIALRALEAHRVRVKARSRWYRSPAHPPSDQPPFLNGVVRVETSLDPARLMDVLHAIEARLGRVRREPNAARPIDLDLLDYDGQVRSREGGPELPHPRMAERDFVLRPLAEIAPGWRHPVLGLTVEELLARPGLAGPCTPLEQSTEEA